MKTLLTFLALGLFSTAAFAIAYDTGKITSLYTDEAGNVAVKLDSGFPKSIAANECPTYTGFAGVVSSVNPALKATLLAAKASQSPVMLVLIGCEAGGAWLKIYAVYVN